MFDKLKVRTRLLFILIISMTALLSVGLLAIYSISSSQKELDEVYHGSVENIAYLDTVKSSFITQIYIPTLQQAIDGTSGFKVADSLHEGLDKLNGAWKSYMKLISPEDAATPAVQSVVQSVATVNSWSATFDEAMQTKNKEQIAPLAAQVNPLYSQIIMQIDGLINQHIAETRVDYVDATYIFKVLKLTTITSLLIAFIVLASLTIAIIRSIVKPLEYAADRITGLGLGDTQGGVEVVAGGELGRLLEAVSKTCHFTDKMSSSLATIAGGDLTEETTVRSDRDVLGHALKDMLVQMRLVIGQIKSEVNVLASSSEEIGISLSHLATGASSEASAVTETTTTIEELKQTANISVNKAKDVLANAEETLHTVAVSEQSVMVTIEDMNQIRDRMQIISDRILKLSEKGLAIAAIMDTVNEIAEQSNLLAVNAAIEAAKAGEVGFSVVAQEMRTLAEQSKGATIQVKALLGDIQHATSEAVLATEQGSKAVAKGVEQSLQTSHAIKELADKMAKVKQAADQIVLSNQEQLIGTEQITIAMSQISDTTNQLVEHLKQIELAVSSLNHVGSSLKGLTDKYRISGDIPLANLTIPQLKRKPTAMAGR